MSRALEIFQRLSSDGEQAVKALIADYQSENLWLDFKRSADKGSGIRLNIHDRENLAKAISGFGNSDGGVVIWGVDCRRDPKSGADLPSDLHPIESPHRFVSWLEGVVSSCTAPAHAAVESFAICSPGSATGFVATHIPGSMDAPLQCIQPTDRAQYYMRAGSSFAPVPHAVLAGLFGRRPQPRVAQKWFYPSVSMRPPSGGLAQVIIALSSTGRAIARDLYLNVWGCAPGPQSLVKFDSVDELKWQRHDVAGNYWSVISKESLRLAPGASAMVGTVTLILSPPFTQSFSFELSYGCEGGERRQWRIDVPPNDVAEACEALNASRINGNQFVALLLGKVD